MACARECAARSARRPADPIHVPARRCTIRIRWSARRAAKRSKRDSAVHCRCPNTWWSSWHRKWTCEHLDGRARLAELARPLLKRIPAGVYQELLIDRLAKQVGMPAGRLAALLLEPGRRRQRLRRQAPVAKATLAAGRGSLVRQAITLLLNHPEAAKADHWRRRVGAEPQSGSGVACGADQ